MQTQCTHLRSKEHNLFFFDTQGAQPLVTDCQRKNESLMGMRNQEHFFLYKSRTLYLLVCEHGANGKGM